MSTKNTSSNYYVHFSGLKLGEYVSVAFLGLSVGFMVVVFGGVLSTVVASEQVAVNIATILSAAAALGWLIHTRITRPLIVSSAAAISLWGVTEYLMLTSLWTMTISVVILYMVAYLLFVWLARIRRFWVMILVVGMVVIAAQLTLIG